jgi:hypothetical protein
MKHVVRMIIRCLPRKTEPQTQWYEDTTNHGVLRFERDQGHSHPMRDKVRWCLAVC